MKVVNRPRPTDRQREGARQPGQPDISISDLKSPSAIDLDAPDLDDAALSRLNELLNDPSTEHCDESQSPLEAPPGKESRREKARKARSEARERIADAAEFHKRYLRDEFCPSDVARDQIEEGLLRASGIHAPKARSTAEILTICQRRMGETLHALEKETAVLAGGGLGPARLELSQFRLEKFFLKFDYYYRWAKNAVSSKPADGDYELFKELLDIRIKALETYEKACSSLDSQQTALLKYSDLLLIGPLSKQEEPD